MSQANNIIEGLTPETRELFETFDQTAFELGVWPHIDSVEKRYVEAKDLFIARILALETELNILRLGVQKQTALAG